jgi:hypothetical protein
VHNPSAGSAILGASRLVADFINVIGPEPTSRDARYLVTIEGKADMPQTSWKDRV